MKIFKNINDIITIINILWLIFIIIGAYYLLLLITKCDKKSFPNEQFTCIKETIVCAWNNLIKFFKSLNFFGKLFSLGKKATPSVGSVGGAVDTVFDNTLGKII
jgi:hypothetical protein